MALEKENSELNEGGYDCEFVEPGPSDRLKCLICHLVARHAHQATCCIKIICKDCIKKHNCPNSTNDQYFEDKIAQNDISNLQTYCTYKNEGCTWQGILNEVNAHVIECSAEEVTCDKCDERMERQQLKSHRIEKCLHRNYECPHCKVVGIYQEITTSHLEECPDLVLTCPNEGCEDKMKRQEMGAHREICPKEVIICFYHDIGCQTEIEREMMDEHMKTNTQAHLQIATKKIREQQQRKCPVIMKFSKFSKHKSDKDTWYSSGFYTSAGGYKLRLLLYADGDDDEGGCISCFIYTMPGEYDDTLEWPFQGKVTVELLNQLEDKNHYKKVIHFNHETPDECKNRKKEENCNEWGQHQFIPHTHLVLNPSNTQYLMNDTLYFRVSVNVHSKTKPWLGDII